MKFRLLYARFARSEDTKIVNFLSSFLCSILSAWIDKIEKYFYDYICNKNVSFQLVLYPFLKILLCDKDTAYKTYLYI